MPDSSTIANADPRRLGREFQIAAKRGSVDIGPVIELSQAMLGLIMGSDTPIATLLALRDRDDFTYVHSVNVGILAGCQAAALGLPEKEVEQINAAGLLHDVGKSRVPEGILQKTTPLTLQEKAMLAAHSLEGARMLYSSQGASKLPALVAAEHHQLAGEVTDPPVLASQLVALADIFDSLRSLRPFDERDGMKGALVYMFTNLRSRFNPYLLARFATLCGMFVPGDMAELTTGELTKVVRFHPESALHPTVQVVDNATGSLRPGTVVDLAQPPPGGKRPSLKLPVLERFATVTPTELEALA